MIPGKQYTPDELLRILWRGKWLVLVSFVLVTTATIVVASRIRVDAPDTITGVPFPGTVAPLLFSGGASVRRPLILFVVGALAVTATLLLFKGPRAEPGQPEVRNQERSD